MANFLHIEMQASQTTSKQEIFAFNQFIILYFGKNIAGYVLQKSHLLC